MLKIVIDSNNLNVDSKYIFSQSFLNKKMEETLSQSISKSTNQIINMEELQKLMVPIIKDVDIFLSYSHDDTIQVQRLASFFIQCGYKVFLDHLFWKDVDKVLDEFNKNTINYLTDHLVTKKPNYLLLLLI